MAYTLVEIWRPRPEWYALSKERKQNLVSKGGELIGKIIGKGAKVIGSYRCRANSEGGWDMIGLWEMPSFDLVVELAEAVEKLGWNRYFEQVNMVGKSIPLEDYFKSLLEDTLA